MYPRRKKQPVYINAYYKDHFSYALGSWWVFSDSTNSIADSFAVLRNYHKSPYTYEDNKEESIQLTVFQYSFGPTGTTETKWYMQISAPHYLSISLIDDQWSYSQNLLSGIPSETKEEVRHKAEYGLYTLYRCEQVSNVLLGGRLWPALYKVTNQYDSSSLTNVRFYDTWYISPDSGIVYLDRSDNVAKQELYLRRCNIVR